MNDMIEGWLRQATKLTQGHRLQEATAVIQRALGNLPTGPAQVPPWRGLDDLVIDLPGPEAPMPMPWRQSRERPAAEPSVDGAFISGSHAHASRTLGYKLFVPPGHVGRSLPLVVMLHGCTQHPDDFAAGTGMNERARAQGFFVLYPAQAQEANPNRCWNWFKHSHQQRGRGEPAVIAAMTQAVIQAHGIDPDRVYIAGLSAGGAMAAIVAAAYPEVYAAVGVHSGLPLGAASSMPEAFAAMKNGKAGAGVAMPGRTPGPAPAGVPVPTIVFHGDQDQTVHPRNGEQVIEALLRTAEPGHGRRTEQGASAYGRRYTRAIHQIDEAPALAEHWLVHGAGHAWSGGHASGSYTDPTGPDATGEMLRFFFDHPHARG